MQLKKPLPKSSPMVAVWMRAIKELAQAMRISERQAALHLMEEFRREAARLENPEVGEAHED